MHCFCLVGCGGLLACCKPTLTLPPCCKPTLTLPYAALRQAFSILCHEGLLHGGTMGLKTIFTDHSLFGFSDPSAIHMNKVRHAASCPRLSPASLLWPAFSWLVLVRLLVSLLLPCPLPLGLLAPSRSVDLP